jgi:hypothetical protein
MSAHRYVNKEIHKFEGLLSIVEGGGRNIDRVPSSSFRSSAGAKRSSWHVSFAKMNYSASKRITRASLTLMGAPLFAMDLLTTVFPLSVL